MKPKFICARIRLPHTPRQFSAMFLRYPHLYYSLSQKFRYEMFHLGCHTNIGKVCDL